MNEPSPHFYVYRIGHNIPTVKHQTMSTAVQEAERLAGQHPGETFEVLECRSITRTKTPETVYTRAEGEEEASPMPEPTIRDVLDWVNSRISESPLSIERSHYQTCREILKKAVDGVKSL
jgi:hypothetical protein